MVAVGVPVGVAIVVVVGIVSYASLRDVAGDSLNHRGKRAEHNTSMGTTAANYVTQTRHETDMVPHVTSTPASTSCKQAEKCVHKN